MAGRRGVRLVISFCFAVRCKVQELVPVLSIGLNEVVRQAPAISRTAVGCVGGVLSPRVFSRKVSQHCLERGVVLEKIWRTYVWASGKRACFFVPCKLAACGPPHRLSFSSKLLASHERPCGDRRTNSRERERVSTQSRESPGVSSPCAFIGIGRRDGKKGGARNSKRRGEDREGRGRSPSASKRRSEGPKVRGGPRRSAEASSELGFCERFVRPFCGLGPLGRRVEAELQRVRDEATDLKAGAPWRPGASSIVTLQLVAPAKHRKAKHPAQLDKLRQTLTTKLLTQL